MDPLSAVLALLKIENYFCGGFDAAGDWSIAFDQDDGIRFYAAVSGECWLSVDGVPDAVRIREGDCILLPRGQGFRVASDLALTPVSASATLPALNIGGVTYLNGGGEFFSVGGFFSLAGDHVAELLGLLPAIIHLHQEADKAALHWCVDRMRREWRAPQPGGFLVAQQLAMLMLVQVLRTFLTEGSPTGVGWLFAIADKRMAAALGAMHHDLAANWTLQSLARHVGMSRTSFAVRFKETVGTSPMEYLTRFRMMVAGSQLVGSCRPICSVALSVGYKSESAFSTAFKRVLGCSPRQYRHER